MNIRSSIGLVGIFLALFWLFGLMLALDRTRVDEAFVLPSLKAASTVEIDSVVVERAGKGKDAEEFRFTRKDDNWMLHQGKQAIKVESFRITTLIREVREAKRDADAKVSDSLSSYGLQPPQATVTLSGKARRKGDDKDSGPEREWKLLFGNESPDKKYVYASTSDFPSKVFALQRSTVNGVFFKSANDLRSKRIFDFSEPTVQSFSLKEGSAEVEAKKTSGGAWLFVKPNLGYADYEGPTPPKDAPPIAPAPEGGLKNLINAIAAVRVDSEDDFVPPTSDTLQRNDLALGKERLRIQVFSGDEKKPTEETLLVGREEKDYYYARLATDEGTFKLQKKLLTPIMDALKAPEKLRSRDLAPISIKDADAITMAQGKDETRFTNSGEPKTWQIELPGASRTAANGKAVESLLDALQGKRDVIEFKDVADAEATKVDADLGFDAPQTSVAVYINGLETGKEAKKDDPKLKKDAKPAVSWQFGKTDKEQVWVKRTMPDGPTARFAINKLIFDKILPREGMLAYLDPSLPKFNEGDVIRMEIDRGGKSVTLEKKNDRWMLKDASGDTPADAKKVADIARSFASLQVKRWVKKIDPKEDFEAYGLKSPSLTLTLGVKMDKLNAQALGSALGQLGGMMNDPALAALGAAWGNLQLGGEKIVVKFGKEATDKDDTGNIFLQHSQSDRLSLAPADTASLLRDADFRDRSIIFHPQVQVAILAIGSPGILDLSPLITGRLGRSDGSQVKELRVTVRTPVELRTFSFVRKDKNWVDQSGLKEFQVDEEHVNSVADLVARLDVNRIVSLKGGPKSDQKLTPKDATLVIDAVMADLRVVSLTVGANFESLGYFTQTSTWQGAIFLLNPERVQPILRGAGFFAKERVAAN